MTHKGWRVVKPQLNQWTITHPKIFFFFYKTVTCKLSLTIFHSFIPVLLNYTIYWSDMKLKLYFCKSSVEGQIFCFAYIIYKNPKILHTRKIPWIHP